MTCSISNAAEGLRRLSAAFGLKVFILFIYLDIGLHLHYHQTTYFSFPKWKRKGRRISYRFPDNKTESHTHTQCSYVAVSLYTSFLCRLQSVISFVTLFVAHFCIFGCVVYVRLDLYIIYFLYQKREGLSQPINVAFHSYNKILILHPACHLMNVRKLLLLQSTLDTACRDRTKPSGSASLKCTELGLNGQNDSSGWCENPVCQKSGLAGVDCISM